MLRKIAIEVVIIAVVILLGAGVLVYDALFGGVSGFMNRFDYYTAATVTLGDHGRTLTSTVYSECRGTVTTKGIAPGTHIQRLGGDNYFVLADDSVLVVPKLSPCRWVKPLPPAGTAYRLDPHLQSVSTARKDDLRAWHAEELWRFDDRTDARTATLYDATGLFDGGTDGIGIDRLQVSLVADGTGEPADTLRVDFPWLAARRSAATVDEQPATFHGYRAAVTQLTGGSRCAGFAPIADGPYLMTDTKCSFVNPCKRGTGKVYCGVEVGWLEARTGGDFQTVSFSLDDKSAVRRALVYREDLLLEAGAPGRTSELRKHDRDQPVRMFYWRPRLCLETLCVDTSAGRAAGATAAGFFYFYYPSRNVIVTVVPLHEDVGGLGSRPDDFHYD